ncbi:glycosyltransferase [Cetobacterium somerae]|uniref:glycosyltransferase family 2 protein n=1 Tax=Cetobacterium somerae TaxID=188913 RepID=UPI00211DF097|nr:glycosyltransferase [Cetobacterium somerae]MCQ9626450.1 glycosyltransferase [Cetobacterium somerae]
MPKISIIVPVYNVEKYLRRCIDSILMQTFREFELILINDGSLDKSGLICDEYLLKDERIKVIHKKNEGCSAARNDGLKISRAEYISFVDSDDWVETTLYEEMYFLMEKEKSDIVESGFFKYKDNILILKKDIDKKEYFPTVWAKLFKKSIIDKHNIKFLLNVHCGEDLLFVEYYKSVCNKIAVSGIINCRFFGRMQCCNFGRLDYTFF